jgi:hypothetical protein
MEKVFFIKLTADYVKVLSKNLDSNNDLFLMDFGALQNLHEFIDKSFDADDLTNEEYTRLIHLKMTSKSVIQYAQTRDGRYL